jgi:hypothetical protein
VFKESREHARYWREKLDARDDQLDLPDGPKLQGLIRARTMKRGGVGYVQPDGGSFPTLADMNRFVLEAQGIPCLAWLDGTSEGEQEIERLFKTGIATGTACFALIPDRNFTPGVKDDKLQHLHEVIKLAESYHFPVVIGTEMNSPGQKFVDDFDAAELEPLVPIFLKGAHIAYAHSLLQRHACLGYLSEWAAAHFEKTTDKNAFYEEFGRRFNPEREDRLENLTDTWNPSAIMDLTKGESHA